MASYKTLYGKMIQIMSLDWDEVGENKSLGPKSINKMIGLGYIVHTFRVV